MQLSTRKEMKNLNEKGNEMSEYQLEIAPIGKPWLCDEIGRLRIATLAEVQFSNQLAAALAESEGLEASEEALCLIYVATGKEHPADGEGTNPFTISTEVCEYITKLQSEKDSIEASAAAMREALTKVFDYLDGRGNGNLRCYDAIEKINIALSTSAGADLLARHREIVEDLLHELEFGITVFYDIGYRIGE